MQDCSDLLWRRQEEEAEPRGAAVRHAEGGDAPEGLDGEEAGEEEQESAEPAGQDQLAGPGEWSKVALTLATDTDN